MAEEETKFVELMFGAKVAIADWPLPVGHRPLKHFARIPVLFRIGEAQDSVPPADRLRAALPLGTNRAP